MHFLYFHLRKDLHPPAACRELSLSLDAVVQTRTTDDGGPQKGMESASIWQGLHLLSQLLAPLGNSRGVQLAQCAAQLLRNCSCIALEHHSRLISIPLAWLHIHQDKLYAGGPLGWIAKV